LQTFQIFTSAVASAMPDARMRNSALPEDMADLRSHFQDMHPADIAELMHHVDDDAAVTLFASLDDELRADVLVELNESLRDEILSSLPKEEILPLVSEMESDDAADVVQDLRDLDAGVAQQLLEGLDKDLREDVESLLEFPDDSAGGVMAREIVAVPADVSVDQAILEVRRLAESREIEDIYAIYVVDEMGFLRGVASLQDILLAKEGQSVGDIMDPDVISVDAMMDQEEVAQVARKYDLASVPVVDTAGLLLGRVTLDDVYDITLEEAEEDIHHLAGTDEEVLEHSSMVIVRERLPWLLVGLFGGMMAALLMSLFEGNLRVMLEASFFVPVVMGMGGAVGIQSSTIVVRGLATGELQVSDFWQRGWREMKVSFVASLVCGIILLGVVWLWLGDGLQAMVIATALAVVMVQASVIGALIPLILKKRGIDPAIATGPFITTTNDILGLSVYLILIALFLA
jgi:magnesium transporter